MNLLPCSRFGFRSTLVATTLCLSAAPAVLRAQAAPATPPTNRATTNGATAKEPVVELSVFTVSEEKDIGYESMQTTSGMRTVQELKNVANSISIMNAQLIEDTASLTMEEMAT